MLALGSLALSLGTGLSTLKAQDVEELTSARADVLARRYLRPSRSVFFATDGSQEAERLVQIMLEMDFGEQFDLNTVSNPRLQVNAPESPDSKEGTEALISEVTKALEEEQVGRQIMHSWFPTFDTESGGFTLEMLAQRGSFAATDADIVEAKSAQRNLQVQLNSLGEQLIGRSYVVVYYIYTVRGDKNIEAKSKALVYKLDFGPETMNTFYTQHFGDPEGIEKMEFPLQFLYLTKDSNAGAFIKGLVTGTTIDEKTDYNDLAEKLRKNADVLMANKIQDFQIQSSIVQTSPIAAKIGTKEGLHTDDRYFVVEDVLDKKTGMPKTVRRGAVRVSRHIADDNFTADGNQQDLTHFTQYAGSGIEEGMTLMYRPDIGVGITPLANYMYAGVELDYRISDLVTMIPGTNGKSIPGVFAFFRFAAPFGTKATNDDKFGVVSLEAGNETLTVIRMTFGVRKEFNFARLLNASAEVGYGFFQTSSKDNQLDAPYVDLGARFGCYVSPSVNIFLHGGYDIWMRDSKDLSDLCGITPYNFGLGVRISF